MGKSPDLRRALAEFGVIVLGVLGALAADQWRETRLERQLEADYRVRLAEELREGRDRLEQVDERFEIVRAAAEDLIGVLELGEPPSDVAAFVATAGRAAWSGSVAAQVRYDATYEELLATGSLGLIRDGDLRSALVRHFRGSEMLLGAFEDISGEYHLRFLGLTGLIPAKLVSGDEDLSDPEQRRVTAALTGDEDVLFELRKLKAQLLVVDGFFEREFESLDQLMLMLSTGG